MPPKTRQLVPAKPTTAVRALRAESNRPTIALRQEHQVDGVRFTQWASTEGGEHTLRIDFPTTTSARGAVVIPRGLRRHPADILKKIEDAGGELPWPAPREKLGSLMMTDDLQPHFLTPTPGWHRGVFVPAQAHTMTLDDERRPCAIRVQFDAGQSPFGLCRGTAKAWHINVGALACQSTMLSFSVMVALAASLAKHAGLPEGVLFNIFADSSNGKTTCLRVAMSVAGDPDQIGSYDASKRGMEEMSALGNGYPMLFDDVEKISDDLKAVMRHVQHIITGGKSRRLSRVTKDQLPPLKWTCFGLSTSPMSMGETMKRAGRTPTLSERVRFPDIPFPVGDRGGLFDLVATESANGLQETRARLIQIEQGMRANYGHVFEEWRLKILNRIKPETIANMVDDVMKRVPSLNNSEDRLARKFAVVKVAGELAIRHNILPWPKTHPNTVVGRVWNWAREELHSEQKYSKQPWLALRAALGDDTRVPKLEPNELFLGQLKDLVGIRRKRKGVETVALLKEKLHATMGSEFDTLIGALRAEGAIQTAPGQPGNLTSQLPIILKGAAQPLRRRFYVVRMDTLLAHIAAKTGVTTAPGLATRKQSAPAGWEPSAAQSLGRPGQSQRLAPGSSPAKKAKAPLQRRGR